MPQRKLPPNDVIISLYDEGLSTGEIAERFSVHPATVVGLLRRIGHKRREAMEYRRLAKERNRFKGGRFWLGKKQPPGMVEKRVSKIRGERHYLWSGGMHRRPYRNVVNKEACALCGSKERLGIHHLDDDHYNNDPGNLQVLCVSCHMSVHKLAYWKAYREGRVTPKSNSPTGWRRSKKSVDN